MSMAQSIRQLSKDGIQPEEIASSLVVSIDYVKKVLHLRSRRGNIEELLRALIREQRETNASIRLLLKMPRHPLDLAQQHLDSDVT